MGERIRCHYRLTGISHLRRSEVKADSYHESTGYEGNSIMHTQHRKPFRIQVETMTRATSGKGNLGPIFGFGSAGQKEAKN